MLEAYSMKKTDWLVSLLSIYENLYKADCLQVKKIHGKNSNNRDIPESMICYSKVVLPLLEFLSERRVQISKTAEAGFII
jgi:hypothetical protein